jgi:hypothetical protein
MSSESYTSEFKAWRAGRPAWAKLIKAIKADAADAAELQRLGDEAGASGGEMQELQMIRRNTLQRQAEASRYSAASKKLAGLDNEIEKLRTKAEKASADDHPDAMQELQTAIDERDRYWLTEVAGREQAHNYIEQVAKPLGLD